MPVHVADRLTLEERMRIYRLAGEGYAIREVVAKFNASRSNQGRVRAPGIEKILSLPEAHRHIATFRMEFLKMVKEIPIANKKVRLDDLESIRQRLMFIIHNVHLERSESNISKFLMVSKRLIEVIDLARNEMEQRPGVAIGIGLGQGEMSDISDENIKKERDELLRKATKALNPVADATENSEAFEIN